MTCLGCLSGEQPNAGLIDGSPIRDAVFLVTGNASVSKSPSCSWASKNTSECSSQSGMMCCTASLVCLGIRARQAGYEQRNAPGVFGNALGELLAVGENNGLDAIDVATRRLCKGEGEGKVEIGPRVCSTG